MAMISRTIADSVAENKQSVMQLMLQLSLNTANGDVLCLNLRQMGQY